MMAMPIGRSSAESGNDEFRTELSNHANEIAKQLLTVPLLKGLGGAFREAKLINRSEELLTAIEAPGGEQFLCAYHAKSFEQLGPQQILSPIAARCRQISGSDAAATGEPRQQSTVLVIGMGAGMENAGNDIQPPQSLRQAHCPPILGDLCGNDQEQAQREKSEKQSPDFHDAPLYVTDYRDSTTTDCAPWRRQNTTRRPRVPHYTDRRGVGIPHGNPSDNAATTVAPPFLPSK